MLIIKEQAAYFLDYMDIHENIHLTVTFSTYMPESLWGMVLPLPSPEGENYQIYKMLIDAKLDIQGR